MKVVNISNFGDETVADRLVAENLSEADAKKLADGENSKRGDYSSYYAVVKPDDYVLWRGMADLCGD